MKNLMKLSAIAFVSLVLGACVGAPKLPVGKLKATNLIPEKKQTAPYYLEFNLETDFDESLKLKPEAMGTKVPATIEALDRNWCMDAATKEEVVRYALDWKERYLALQRKYENRQLMCRGEQK